MAQKLLHYDVLERLGEGARSTIYAVRDPGDRQGLCPQACRTRDEQKDIRFIEQMETEFEITKQFTHPNLRRSFDLKISKTMLLKVSEAFLVMELVEGKPLDVRLPSAMIDIVDTFIQAAQGLQAMHQMGYAHCDIKPNNILRNDHGLVKVIDFGQSCKIGTVKERIQGTPDYIAPEQVAAGRSPCRPTCSTSARRSTGRSPGRHIPTLYTVNKKGENSFLLDTRIDTPQDLNPRVPPALSNLVMECISTSPQKRPADMDAVITRLELSKHILNKQANPSPQPNPGDELTVN